jgi:hypothetical protein
VGACCVRAWDDAVEAFRGRETRAVSLQTATTAQGGRIAAGGSALDECTVAALHMRARVVCPGHSIPEHNLVNTTFSDGVLDYLLQPRYPGYFPFWQLEKEKESHITF